MAGWSRPLSVFFSLFWFILRDFFRSPWSIFSAICLVLLQFFLPAGDPARNQYFGLIYLFMMTLSAVDTLGIFSRANSSHTYAILARPISRTAYILASMLAALVAGILSYLVVTAFAFLRYGPPFHVPSVDWLAGANYLSASLPVIVGIAFAVSLMTLLAAFVAPFWVRFVVLAIISILVMSFDPRNFPVPFMQTIVEHIPPLLAPVAGAIRFATETPPDSLALASVIILAAYTSTLLAIVLWLSTRRDLVLE